MRAAEIDEARGQAIGAEIGVALDQRHRAKRLAAEQVARGVHGVAADVIERAAADVLAVADVGGVAVEIGERRLHAQELADAPALHPFSRQPPLRVIADHEGFADQFSGLALHRDQRLGIGGIECDRFFAQHMLAGPCGARAPVHMHVVGQRIVDHVDLGIGQQLLIAAIGPGNPERLRRGLGLCDVARGERNDFCQRAALHAGQTDFLGKIAGPENTPAHGRERLVRRFVWHRVRTRNFSGRPRKTSPYASP
jgi:hypothetical protein